MMNVFKVINEGCYAKEAHSTLVLAQELEAKVTSDMLATTEARCQDQSSRCSDRINFYYSSKQEK